MSDSEEPAPLEDVMAAMDVVDTLRHDLSIAERELDGEGRRERLLERLKELYSAQGIEVPEHVLQDGIDALEQERFQYTPVDPSWQTRLATMWVSRKRWSKPVGFLAIVASLFFGFYIFTDVLPARQIRAELPGKVQRSLATIESVAKNPDVITQAAQYAREARTLIDQEELDEAQVLVENMQSIAERLQQAYTIRVVSRANERSGVWRRPPNNPQASNYYLIVEAVDKNNRAVELSITNQENNKVARKKVWGLRVNAEMFHRIAADKQDDGIIQNNNVGEKKVGYLKPTFSIPTTGATITEW